MNSIRNLSYGSTGRLKYSSDRMTMWRRVICTQYQLVKRLSSTEYSLHSSRITVFFLLNWWPKFQLKYYTKFQLGSLNWRLAISVFTNNDKKSEQFIKYSFTKSNVSKLEKDRTVKLLCLIKSRNSKHFYWMKSNLPSMQIKLNIKTIPKV